MTESDAWSDESYENEEVTESDANTSLCFMVSVLFVCLFWIEFNKLVHIM